ncbi:uncharacterized protein LOC143819938 isoform X2 [Paroedura picta]|uniref:uncharacterized protein LOC143819938 isoform X2 n=1 Tax=Paroedura picta TaxID=143630 RepID=UPI004057B360
MGVCPLPPANGLRPHRRTVFIVGHSIVYWAGRYAAESGWTEHLGLEDAQCWWIGHRGMKWRALLSAISTAVHRWGSPSIVAIQLGENDLPETPGCRLIHSISDDLLVLRHRLPKSVLLWSELLSRQVWRGASKASVVNRTKAKVNRSVAKVMQGLGGRVIRHPDIDWHLAALYRPDGVHLSDWGHDVWLHSIRWALLYVLRDLRLAGTSVRSVAERHTGMSLLRGAGVRSASPKGSGPQ